MDWSSVLKRLHGKVFIAQFIHETNTMSTETAGMAQFERRGGGEGVAHGDEAIAQHRGINSCPAGFIEVAEREGIELVASISASAVPSGKVTKDAYDRFKGQILDDLVAAGDIDGVLLSLHGAMVVEGIHGGAENDLVRAIREQIGNDIPIVITLDPHGNISDELVNSVDGIFAYNTIPHIDMYERGVEAAEALIKIVRGEIRPRLVRERVPMMVPSGYQLMGYPEAEGPLPNVAQAAQDWEQQENVLNVNIFIGFDRADIPDVGACIVAMADGDETLAKRAAQSVGQTLWDLRYDFLIDSLSPQEAITKALSATEWPIALADMEDAPSGGGTGDGTEIIRTMLSMGVNSAVVWLSDEEAVHEASTAGVGETLTLKVGGKRSWRTDGKHAQPLEVNAYVRTINDGQWTIKGPSGTGTRVDMGKTVVLDVNGIELVVSEHRTDPKDPELFRSVGIEPTERNIVVIKSKHHWRAAWQPIVRDILVVQCPADYSLSTIGKPTWTYENVTRPIWPLDEDTSYRQ